MGFRKKKKKKKITIDFTAQIKKEALIIIYVLIFFLVGVILNRIAILLSLD